MKKLVRGIIEFRQQVLPRYRDTFAQLAAGQSPDALFIACCDSRVVPNLFASTDPGDLFVVRNVGNLIPACGDDGVSLGDESEAAAVEFAVMNLHVSNIIVCGHSDCGAMHALMAGREKVAAPNLRAWLRHGEPALAKLSGDPADPGRVNQLSKLNVLQQLEHLKSFPVVAKRMERDRLRLHGWWFELATASVYAHNERTNTFELIDETAADRILADLP